MLLSIECVCILLVYHSLTGSGILFTETSLIYKLDFYTLLSSEYMHDSKNDCQPELSIFGLSGSAALGTVALSLSAQ